jgi:hypothetical protein
MSDRGGGVAGSEGTEMPKKDDQERAIDWFGADVEEDPARHRTAVYLDGFRGVDADVPRQQRQPDGTVKEVLVRRPAPRIVQARTTAGPRAGHDIGRLTARYKTFREAARFAAPDDREAWETRRDIAFAEMQVARFRQKLERYQSGDNARPEQVQLLKNTVNQWRGRFAELTGQA